MIKKILEKVKRNKIRVILYSLVLVLLLITVSSSLALFENNSTAVVNPEIGKWVIYLNNNLITDGVNENITINNFVYEENQYVEENYIAPGGSAYVDLVLDTTNCDVAVRYDITFNLEDTNYADNISFSINDTYDVTVRTDENTYSGAISLESIENDETITLRINVDWEDLVGYDEDDTVLGGTANSLISVPINVKVNQYFGEEIVEYEG